MSMSEQMPLAEVKNRLSEVVERIDREHGRVVITKHGQPSAVMMSTDDLEALEETLEVLSSSELVNDIRESLMEREPATVLTKDEALSLLSRG